MASITIADEKRRIDNPEEMRAFLAPFGIYHRRWPLEERSIPTPRRKKSCMPTPRNSSN